MTFEGARITEQGVTFVVIVVKEHVLNNRTEAENLIESFSGIFPGDPIVLMAQDSRGTPKYLGRPDLSKFLASIEMSRIPWKKYTVS